MRRSFHFAFLVLAAAAWLGAEPVPGPSDGANRGSDEPRRAPPLGHDYFLIREGLGNCRIKFERERFGRVVFLGGSITHMTGWRDLVSRDLQRRFPQTRFEFIDAGIPSLGSTPGAFRFARDCLAHGPIDLLFEEAAVNDVTNGQTGLQQVRGMEGILRQARVANPWTDEVVLYFAQDAAEAAASHAGIQPEVIQNHERVAAHYGVPSIDLVREIGDRISSGEFTWAAKIKSEHVAPFGQQLYANAIGRLFAAAWTVPLGAHPELRPHPLPAPLDPASYFEGRLVDPAAAIHDERWRLDPSWQPKDGKNTRPGFVGVPMLVTAAEGAGLRLRFAGTAVGIFVVSGPATGAVRYRLDGGAWATRDLHTRWSDQLHLPWAQVLAEGLSPGPHVLELRTARSPQPGRAGSELEIVSFLVNGTPRGPG